jgi:hypothetical protein
MTNPYLAKLRAQNQKAWHSEEPPKPSEPGFEGFEGDRGSHILENHCPDEGNDVAAKNSKNATPAYPQDLQNPSSPSVPNGTKVEIVELPAAGLRYRRTFAVLQLRPPALVPVERWKACVEDGKRFLARWGEQAQALGWTSADLFGLAPVPAKPAPSYRRLSRYDLTGLCWLLQGREVAALTEATATIRNPFSGSITVYRRFHKLALGPLGDSLQDLTWPMTY